MTYLRIQKSHWHTELVKKEPSQVKKAPSQTKTVIDMLPRILGWTTQNRRNAQRRSLLKNAKSFKSS
jgi:hypothetical protein